MPEYKNVATVEIGTGYEEFEWPEYERALSGTWWVDKDGDLGVIRYTGDGFLRLIYTNRHLSFLPGDSLRKQIIQGRAYPVAVRITARRVEP